MITKRFKKLGRLPVRDAKASRSGVLELEHIEKGIESDPWRCAYANAMNTQPDVVGSHFYHSCAWIVRRIKGKLTGERYMLPQKVRDDITTFDTRQKGKLVVGAFTLLPPTGNDKLGKKTKISDPDRERDSNRPSGRKHAQRCKRGFVQAICWMATRCGSRQRPTWRWSR